jgi:hypothetical protein
MKEGMARDFREMCRQVVAEIGEHEKKLRARAELGVDKKGRLIPENNKDAKDEPIPPKETPRKDKRVILLIIL